MYELFLIFLAFIWLVTASICDFKSREIPNWISFSLIIFALSYRAFVSVFSYNIYYFLYGLLGFGVFFLLGNLFYYIGFGGGDAKLLMALGPVLPFSLIFSENINIFINLLFSLLFLGAIYSLLYSFFIVIGNHKKFSLEFMKKLKQQKTILLPLAPLFILFAILSWYNTLFLPLAAFILVVPFLFIYSKSFDEIMIKRVSTKKLVEGDWLIEEIKIGKRFIKPRVTGLEEEEIELLKKHKRSILIREGIPFTVTFLFAFIVIVGLWYSSWKLNYYFWF